MDLRQYEIAKIIEECSEVIKVGCKIQRFGDNESNPKTTVTNKEEFIEEVKDLLYAIERAEGQISLSFEDRLKRVVKYDHYLELSRRLERVSD